MLRKIQKSSQYALMTPKEMNEVTFLWANDGWCYIPELKQRRKYVLNNDGIVEVLVQVWAYAIPLPQHVEKVTQSVLQETPRVLQEQTEHSCELYEEVPETQTAHTKTHGR
jgi:hypothetical protein